MCRHLAWVGEPVTLSSFVLDAPHALTHQAYAPRLQENGVVNADGFGVGWYAPGRTEPVRYRRPQPIWGDSSFASLAPTITTRCLLATVRDATPGFASSDESCTAPFTHGPWLFSHNGALTDWPRARKALYERTLDVPEAAAPVDSALLFGVAVTAWTAGASLAEGLAETVRAAESVGGGRLAFLATDGTTIAATTCGDRIFCREDRSGMLVASEPLDDSGGWREMPAGFLVEAGTHAVHAVPVEECR